MEIETIETVSPDLFEEPRDRETKKALFKRYVSSVILELFDYCNRQCVYCPVSLVDRMSSINRLDTGHLDKIVRDLKAIEFDGHLCLNLFNEPMADDSLYDAMAKLHEALPAATLWFNSNGDYLNRETLDRLAAAGLSRLVVTLHVAKNKTYDDLHQLTRYSQLSARTGLTLTFERYRPGRKITATANYKGISIVVKSADHGANGENRAGLMTDIPVDAQRSAPCDRPFDEFTISWNGDVYPCCQFFAGAAEHDPFVVGNIGDADNLYDLYAARLMASFRTDLFTYGTKKSPCSSCIEYDVHGGDRDVEARTEAARRIGLGSVVSEAV